MAEQKFTPRAENVLRLAQETALELGHGYVGCEHILLGLRYLRGYLPQWCDLSGVRST